MLTFYRSYDSVQVTFALYGHVSAVYQGGIAITKKKRGEKYIKARVLAN